MADDADWLPDLAALATLSVAVHYVLGLYGLLGALLIFVVIEHGSTLIHQLRKTERTPSALESDASTEGDDEIPRPPPEDNEEEQELDEEQEEMQRLARQRTANLIVRDVGSGSTDMEMNSRAPIPFETELFSGHALFLVRTQPQDPHYAALFAGKRRMFWIQVQGRFKKIPRGPVYLGGELPSRIAPGVFTRSVALVIMGLIRRLVGRVSFSFGSSVESENADELPAVAFPLYQSVDQFVETQEGEMPPELGTADFGETEEQRVKRRHTPLGEEKYEVGRTYTFDFHTMYVDLTRWETANLPGGLNAMDLASFFDSLPLRLVAYDVRSTGLEASDSHHQRDKDYLFSFEVKYNKHKRRIQNGYEAMTTEEAMREGSGRGSGSGGASTVSGTGMSLMGSEISTMSTTLSDASSLTEDDPVLAQEHAAFLRLEHARRLGQLSFSYMCWMEEVDVGSDVRRVHYVFAVKDKVGEYDEGEVDEEDEMPKAERRYRLAIVSSYELHNLLQGRHTQKTGKAAEEMSKLRFHSRARIGSYSTISTEARQVVMHLQSLAAEPFPSSALPSYSSDYPSDTETLFDGRNDEDDMKALDDNRLIAVQAALYKCLMKRQRLQESYTPSTKLSPSRIGVNLSRRDREDMGAIFEGVVYRFNAAELLRQEVLLLTKDALLFYRSFASSADKQVPCSHIIGARVVEVPSGAAYHDGGSSTDGTFALQISTFAEEIVLCVGTASTRDAWVRGVMQYCNPKANFDRALQGEMYIGFTASSALRPASRVELNSRSLFPQLTQQELLSCDANGAENIAADTISGALKLVERTLRRALHILNNAQHLSVTKVLAFLDDASALRAVDLQQLQDSGSHEEQVSFYLNLYHTILAHAMIAQGFPRGKGQWSHFLTRTCYALSRGPNGEQVSLSLAEIEHVILRARLPRADLPHLSLNSVMKAANEPGSRLLNLGIAHPDFRLSLALVMNHRDSDKILIYEPESLHDQLNAVLRSLLKRSNAQGYLEMKEDSNTIILPRVCEWYRHDFGGVRGPQRDSDASATYCVRKLLGFMDENLQMQVINALGLDDAPLRTKYRSFKYTPKTTLVEDISWRPSAPEDVEPCSTCLEEGGGTTQL